MNTEFSPYEYLADNIDVRIKGERSIKDLDTAAQGIISYTKIRVLEVFHAHNDYLENNENEKSGKLGLMLSGGIDSVLLAAVLKDLGIDFHAVTVAAKGLNHFSVIKQQLAVMCNLCYCCITTIDNRQ